MWVYVTWVQSLSTMNKLTFERYLPQCVKQRRRWKVEEDTPPLFFPLLLRSSHNVEAQWRSCRKSMQWTWLDCDGFLFTTTEVITWGLNTLLVFDVFKLSFPSLLPQHAFVWTGLFSQRLTSENMKSEWRLLVPLVMMDKGRVFMNNPNKNHFKNGVFISFIGREQNRGAMILIDTFDGFQIIWWGRMMFYFGTYASRDQRRSHFL